MGGVSGVPGCFKVLSKLLEALELVDDPELELDAGDNVPSFGRKGVVCGILFLKERRGPEFSFSLLSLLSLGNPFVCDIMFVSVDSRAVSKAS